MISFGKTLVVAAHPDDETLGCGGTVAKLAAEGELVRVIFVAEGSSCRFSSPNQEAQDEIAYRNQCSIEALKVLGVTDYHFYNFPCGRLGDEPIIDLAKVIENEIESYQPNTVLTHCHHDVHNDHKVVFQLALQATRPVGNSVRNLISFEILSSTEWRFIDAFQPNLFVDITSVFDQKMNAMNCYSTEQPPEPHPRSDGVIRALATLRGSQSGVRYAEGFEIVRTFNV